MLTDIYFDWQDNSSFVGKGLILKKLYTYPVICIENIFYQPRRCLVEIKESNIYSSGFKKHFIIPFKITEEKAKKLNKELSDNKRNFNEIVNNILLNDNYIMNTREEMALRDYVIEIRKKYSYRNLKIPQHIALEILKRKNELNKYKQ